MGLRVPKPPPHLQCAQDLQDLADAFAKIGAVIVTGTDLDWGAWNERRSWFSPPVAKDPWKPPWIVRVWIDALRGCWHSIREIVT